MGRSKQRHGSKCPPPPHYNYYVELYPNMIRVNSGSPAISCLLLYMFTVHQDRRKKSSLFSGPAIKRGEGLKLGHEEKITFFEDRKKNRKNVATKLREGWNFFCDFPQLCWTLLPVHFILLHFLCMIKPPSQPEIQNINEVKKRHASGSQDRDYFYAV